MVLANLAWLGDVEDEELTDNVARNIVILRQKKKTSRILTLHEKAMLLKSAETRTEEEKQALQECTKGLKCFRRYPKSVKKKLSEVIYYLYYGPGRVIIKQGHPAEKMYFIISGEVSLSTMKYDEILEKMVIYEHSILHPGAAFGEVTLLTHNTRRSTCSTHTTCELLCVNKEDFEIVLRNTIRKTWKIIKECMKKFSYFDSWDSYSIQQMCMLSKVNAYKPKAIILGNGFGHLECAYFLVEGTCAMIDELQVVFKQGNKGPYPIRLFSEKMPLTKNESIKPIFFESCTFLTGGLFGFGIPMKSRMVISCDSVMCMVTPVELLLQSRNTNYIWQRTIHYLKNALPSKEQLFKTYIEQQKWSKYRSDLLQYILAQKRSSLTTTRSDIPYFFRLAE